MCFVQNMNKINHNTRTKSATSLQDSLVVGHQLKETYHFRELRHLLSFSCSEMHHSANFSQTPAVFQTITHTVITGHNSLVSPAVKSVLEEVEQCFLHHVCYLYRKQEKTLKKSSLSHYFCCYWLVLRYSCFSNHYISV